MANNKKHHRLYEKSTADRSRIDRVVAKYEEYIERLDDLRSRYANRRFGEFDQTLGRRPGFFAGVSDYQEVLAFDRFLMALDEFDMDLETFAMGLDSKANIPAGAPGVLTRFLDHAQRRSTLLPFAVELIGWNERAAIQPDGMVYPFDVDSIIELSQTHRAAALRTAEGAIEGFLEVRPATLDPDSAEKLARLITGTADWLRSTGARTTACRLVDLAFEIEAKIDRPRLRAFIYRVGTHLLNDWGYLPEALSFAEKSERICLQSGDRDGLSHSLYIEAVCFGLRGLHESAIHYFESSLGFSESRPISFRFAVQHSIAWSWIQLGRLDEAEQASTRLAELLDEAELAPDDMSQALYRSLLAELASLAGRSDEANARFAEADSIFESNGALLERLMLGLRIVRHQIRSEQFASVVPTVEGLLPIASALAGNQWAEAIVIDLVQHALQGELTAAIVEDAIVKFQQATQQNYAQPVGSM